MAGHSKWANIKHRKAAQDSKRGKVFTKIGRELTVAAKIGGSDPDSNSRLRLALDKARSANMPKDNVDRAVKKGTGEGGNQIYEDIMYEGYTTGGIGILIKALTENRNRTIMEVKTTVVKRGGSMAEPGAVSWQFEHKGIIIIPADSILEDALMDLALEAGADDVVLEEDMFTVSTSMSEYEKVKNFLLENHVKIEFSELTMKSKTTVDVAGEDAEKLIALIDALEDLDDVQEVYGAFEIDDSAFDEA